MDITALTTVGLSAAQAEAYALLLERGFIKPPEAAKLLGTSRTNAYKLFDKLVELELATKTEQGKVYGYSANNPMALVNLTARYRTEAAAREEAANNVIHDLLAQYHSHDNKLEVSVAIGRKEVANAYRAQLSLSENVYFIHSRSDVAMMGFDTMHDIRTTPARLGKQRQGILTRNPDNTAPLTNERHKQSRLTVTWASSLDYNAPVEWSVTESSLLIVVYGAEPQSILIADSIVAGAFLQLWKMLNNLLRQQPFHQQLATETGT